MKWFLLILSAIKCLAGGPVPYNANQFPVWYSVIPNSISITGTVETVLMQIPVAPGFMGTNGFLRATIPYVGNDGTAKTFHFYLGPSTFANATTLATVGSGGVANGVITLWLTPNGDPINTVSVLSIKGSSAATTINNTVTVGTLTNNLYFTITGLTAGSGSAITPGVILVEGLTQ